MSRPDMSKNTAATGGMVAPVAPASPSHGETTPPVMTGAPMRSPDQSPNMSDPTGRPDEPITAGLPSGLGAGPEAMTGYDPRAAETAKMKQKWMPYLGHLANDPETPDSVKVLYRYMMGA